MMSLTSRARGTTLKLLIPMPVTFIHLKLITERNKAVVSHDTSCFLNAIIVTHTKFGSNLIKCFIHRSKEQLHCALTS